jgi:hypothetical protein
MEIRKESAKGGKEQGSGTGVLGRKERMGFQPLETKILHTDLRAPTVSTEQGPHFY